MAYRLKRSEPVSEGIKRIVLEEIDSATEQLGKTNHRDEAIHEARKSLKKVRGAMRLVQPELGRTYARENTQLGDVGRKLSELRDATAMIEVFDGLVDKYKSSLRQGALISIRQGLEKFKRDTEQAAGVEVVEQAISTLRAARERAQDWPLESDGFPSVAPGLKERYRRGRKAMALARKDPSPENFHEWRKRVKDHWYHVRLLGGSWTDVLKEREGDLKSLETWLGDDHNLVVLRGKIDRNPEQFGEKDDIRLFLALSTQYGQELRDNALALGERLYEEKPRQFTQNLSKLWEAWQAEPDSLEELKKQHSAPPKKQPAKTEAAKGRKSTAA